jgi:hypothetical protein
MKFLSLLAAFAVMSGVSVPAEAGRHWTYSTFLPWHDDSTTWDNTDDESDVVYYEEDPSDEGDVFYENPRKNIQRAEDPDIWWLEDGARSKLERRPHKRKATAAPVLKKVVSNPVPIIAKSKLKVVVAKPAKPVLKPKLQVASLDKPVLVEKSNRGPIVTPKLDRTTDKTIGCTAGAAVVTGYGFADVRPKACTGKTYAYIAARAGKSYEIQMTSASGEIIDVKKLN